MTDQEIMEKESVKLATLMLSHSNAFVGCIARLLEEVKDLKAEVKELKKQLTQGE